MRNEYFCNFGSRAQEKFKDFEEDETDPALAEFERHRREYINTMKRIRLENPDITPAELVPSIEIFSF